MRLILLLLLAAGLMWAALHPYEFVAGVDRLKYRADEAFGLDRLTEHTPAESPGRELFREWQADPVYGIDTLEALFVQSGERMFLVHLAAATVKGCGEAFESEVLNANLDRIPTRWSGDIETALARKAESCADGP